MRTDTMILSAFCSASATKSGTSGWTHAYAEPDFLSGRYYAKLARTVEGAGFDMMFFDDRLAMPAAYGASHRAAVEKGSRVVKLDPIAILGIASAVTERIGLGATYSTTYHNPFHIARVFASLDHLSGGRAIWNIVTSLNDDEARNFGHTEHIDPNARYDKADEFMAVVTGLWETWSRDAVKLDRETGIYADPEQVGRLDFKGKHYSSRGPLTVPRAPQGWPTLLQAGQSGRGQQFAATWADLTFTSPHTLERAQKQYTTLRELTGQAGRDPEDVKVMPAIRVVVGETTEVAKEKEAYIHSRVDPIEELISMSETANFDFSILPADRKITNEVVNSVTGSRGILEAQLAGARAALGDDPTPMQLGLFVGGRASSSFVGNGREVAEQMAEWFQSAACDGFAVLPTHSPGAFEDFGRLVMPHLRAMGLHRSDTEASVVSTFRDRAGLARRDGGGTTKEV
jgi:FMN-dependent oxidoreductase (nitrilotriacetate monooxygenase family)